MSLCYEPIVLMCSVLDIVRLSQLHILFKATLVFLRVKLMKLKINYVSLDLIKATHLSFILKSILKQTTMMVTLFKF